jgi:hypothetical protein
VGSRCWPPASGSVCEVWCVCARICCLGVRAFLQSAARIRCCQCLCAPVRQRRCLHA